MLSCMRCFFLWICIIETLLNQISLVSGHNWKKIVVKDISPSSIYGPVRDYDCSEISPKSVASTVRVGVVSKHNFGAEAVERNAVQETLDYKIGYYMHHFLKDTDGKKLLQDLLPFIPVNPTEVQVKKPYNLGQAYCNSLTTLEKKQQCRVINAQSTVLGCLLSYPNIDSFYNQSKEYPEVQAPIKNDATLNFIHHDTCIPETIHPATIKTETETYYWLLQSIAHVSDSRVIKASDDSAMLHHVGTIPGWTLIGVVTLLSKKEEYRVPLATLSFKTSTKNSTLIDFLVSIRGSKTMEDWKINFLYTPIALQSEEPDVQAHQGYNALALTIWDVIKEKVAPLARKGKVGEFFITGRSLGAGVASIVSYYISTFLEKEVWTEKTVKSRYGEKYVFPKPRTVLFVPPLVGNTQFVNRLHCLTELRNMNTQYDPVTYLPCPKAPLCPGDLTTIETGSLESPPAILEQFNGRITVDTRNLTNHWNVSAVHLNTLAWHVCAIPCWLSSNVKGAELDRCYPVANVTDRIKFKKRSLCSEFTPIFLS